MKLLKSKTYLSDLNKAISMMNLSKFNNTSILVTGGLGLIGSAVVDLLVKYNNDANSGIEIYVAARDEQYFAERYGDVDCVHFLKYEANKSLDFDLNFDYIIHAAGIASPNLYVEKPVETILSNVKGIENLLEYSKAKHVKRLLYISSSEVYSSEIDEDCYSEKMYGTIDMNSIRSSYPVSKSASEMLCKAYSIEYGVDTVIVRPGHIFGPTATKNDKRVSSDFAYKAALGQDIELKSDGMQRRSYCYCVDCALAILTVLLNGKTAEAYNIGHSESFSIREMAECYANEGNVNIVFLKPNDKDKAIFNPMGNSSLNIEKIKEIGYADVFPTSVGFAHTIQIIRELNERE